MFHVGRSGSTVLGDVLDQHPKIAWDGEIYPPLFRDWGDRGVKLEPRDMPWLPIEHLRKRMTRAGNKYYGFEVKFFHLRLFNTELPEYVEQVFREGVSHFIVLERRNYLKKVVSSLVARERANLYHLGQGEQAPLTHIRLDVDDLRIDGDAKPLLTHLEDYGYCFTTLRGLLKGRNVLNLTYEDHLCDDVSVGYRAVTDFIGLERHKAAVRYGKTNPFSVREVTVNIDEVERALRGTPFEWMLYE